jgi:hypothetical protein
MVNGLQFIPANAGGSPTIQSIGTDTNVGLFLLSKGATGSISIIAGAGSNLILGAGAYQFNGPSPIFFRDANNATVLQLASIASSVDAIQINPATTANPATVSVQAVGTDANINLNLISKGTGAVQINGVAPAAAPTITIKKGTGLGNYTTTSTTYVDVDATNLALTVTVPVGQKIMMWASAETNGSVSSEQLFLAIADGTTTLVEQQMNTNGGNNSQNLAWVFTGDGASHTFKLRFRTNTSTFAIINATATELPVMTFWMGVAN